jgi:hypothetical protein
VSNAASEAAAGLVPEIATELVASSAPSELAGSSLVEEIHAATEREVPSSQPVAPEAQETETEEDDVFELPSFSLIETEEDDELDDDVLLPAAEADENDDEGLYEDPDELRARNAKLEKQNRHLVEQAAQVKQTQWRARFKKMYPLANVDEINATSRRAFEKAAINSHNANYKLLEPTLTQLAEAATKLRSGVTAEARADAAAAFGKPVAGPGIVPLEASAQTEDLVAARKTGDLRKVISVLMGTNK